MRLTTGAAFWVTALVFLPLTLQAATAERAALAAQVNAQIVQQQEEKMAAFLGDTARQSQTQGDVPAACKAEMLEASNDLGAWNARYFRSGFTDPVYERSIEQQLADAYSAAQLQAFLDRRGKEDHGTLNAAVMSAPGLQDAQLAHLKKLSDALDQAMHADPAWLKALARFRVAMDACDQLKRGGSSP